MYAKYSKWPENKTTFSNLGPSKIYPNWDFWFEKKPSGNPSTKRSSDKPKRCFVFLRRRRIFLMTGI
jgi:hypothetical protein